MVEFKELRVSADGKKLIIDACVKNLQYYDDIYIDAVIVDTQTTYVANGPSTNPIFYYEVPYNPDTIYTLTGCNKYNTVEDEEDNEEVKDEECSSEEEEKRVRLELDSATLGTSLNDTLFFIYIVTKGTPSSDTPCGMDNQTTMGVVANLYPFYRNMVNYMREVENECEIPKNFINMFMRFKAFELSIRTGHYTQAIKYWNKFFRGIKNELINTECRCHG